MGRELLAILVLLVVLVVLVPYPSSVKFCRVVGWLVVGWLVGWLVG